MFYKARGPYGSHSLPEQQFLEYLKKKSLLKYCKTRKISHIFIHKTIFKKRSMKPIYDIIPIYPM